MPVSCAAFGCKSRYNLETRDKGITFHRFPKSNPVLLDKWRLAMKRATSSGELWMPSRYQRLCSLHFEEKCFDTTGQTKRLRDDVIPSIFNFEQHDKPKQTTRRTIQKRHKSGSGNVFFNSSVPAHAPTNSCASVSQDHIYSMPDTETLKRKLQDSEDLGPGNESELETKNEQQELATETWASIFKDLTEKHLMTQQLTESLLSCTDLPLQLFRKPESEYSAQQRLFALTLHLYGPKAYDYLVQQMKLPLPCPSTLACWLRTMDDGPGINFSFLGELMLKKNEKPELYTCVSLTIGTMNIQQQVSYDSQKKTMVGFTSFGKQAEANGIHEIASEVMVIMLVGVAGDWKVPIAYFLTKTLTAEASKQLILHALNCLFDFGFQVVALTLDGLPINIQLCTLLGCSFTDYRHLKTCFSIPGRTQKCHVVFDASSELKLMCSFLKTGGAFQCPFGTITWKYINELQNLHKDSELLAHRKHTERHSQMLSQVVRISLIVQLLSKSVSATLNTLKELEHEKFVDCTPTVHFIQVLNRLHDILTCNSPHLQDDKGPVNGKNLPYKINILQETKDYLLSLTTDDNKPLYESSRKRCIFGFLVNITSFLSLLRHLLLVQESVMLHRFSQDHIQLFFCSVQRAGGWNNKPTALKFKQVINRLLLQYKLKDEPSQSVLHTDGIRSSSSLEDNLPLCFQENIPVPFEDTSIRLADHHYSSQALQIALQNSNMYIAGWVVRKALCRISCDTCRSSLVTEDMPKDFSKAYHLLQLKCNGGLFVPSQGAITTTLTAERFFQHMVKVDNLKNVTSRILLEHKVLSEIGNKDIFNLKQHTLETESGIDNHHYQLVRLLTSIYYVLRQPYFSKLAHLIVYKRHMKQILLKSFH